MLRFLSFALVTMLGLKAEVTEVRIPVGAGGVGFLPLLVMQKNQLIEKQAKAAGIPNLKVRWINIGGPSVMNDALLSGSADFITAGPPAFSRFGIARISRPKLKALPRCRPCRCTLTHAQTT
jgi:NitT/TauT family transport system substrate-binding protein